MERGIGTWNRICLIVGIAMLCAAALRASGLLPEGALGACLFLGVFLLWRLAIRLSKRKPALNLTVAAETIVALGIFSLVISVAASVYLAISQTEAINPSNLRPFVLPFLEGLITAALAPLLATHLRNIEASRPMGDSVEMPGVVDASSDLAKQMQLAAEQLKAASAAFGTLNEEIKAQTVAFKEATEAVGAEAGKLIGAFKDETTKLKGALGDFRGDVKALAEAASEGSEALSKLSTEVNKVAGTSGETDEMLKALNRLILSVERFIRGELAA
jgi:methyl-accepting chemotaxis protein